MLAKMDLHWRKEADLYELELKNTLDSIAIVEKLRDYLQSFEVQHGTMDDVFLNITGRRLRE
ncbi:hypothetical protein lacNasYZ03_16720 [Lactobacillus nasalidis]|uniref:ABC transporter ATP-binding protein n=1 Tax=Lactobacillus nasalidis TaxID=2797258 RepID=A0ABQ3W605_9LACO|nr:hypothetical protein lacNasYZ01_14660 [Lactobacillus nasalidis]GHV99409.1 hypothetical protein lacNasYZ02_08390 [Lactobacillus nasalidis]GHW01985.1 hypothetical protein lacNasYZ03_16720 [Lactobacillus nasalidis]